MQPHVASLTPAAACSQAALEHKRAREAQQDAAKDATAEAARSAAGEEFRARACAAHARRDLQRQRTSAMAALATLEPGSGAPDEAGDADLAPPAEPTDAELRDQLAVLHRRLRDSHFYCAFCGAQARAWTLCVVCVLRDPRRSQAPDPTHCSCTQFASHAELAAACPGASAEDHA
jgi:hypothetical protein